MAARNFTSQKLFTFHAMPVLLDCNFVVDPANGNGLGIRNLKGGGVKNVFMHSTASTYQAVGNPNPMASVIIVQLSDNYNRYLTGFSGQVQSVSGTPITVSGGTLTVGHPYVIVSLGTTTTASDWLALGVPAGLNASVGMSFIAAAVGTGHGDAAVMAPAASGVDHIELIGDPNQSVAPYSTNLTAVQGSWIIMQCLSGSAAATPTTGSVISLAFLMSNSSVLVQGE